MSSTSMSSEPNPLRSLVSSLRSVVPAPPTSGKVVATSSTDSLPPSPLPNSADV